MAMRPRIIVPDEDEEMRPLNANRDSTALRSQGSPVSDIPNQTPTSTTEVEMKLPSSPKKPIAQSPTDEDGEELSASAYEVTPLDQIIRDPQEEYTHRNLSLWEGAPWRSRIYSIVEPFSFESDIPIAIQRAALVYSLVTAALVILSCITVMGSSYSDYVVEGFPSQWVLLSTICVAFFTIDTIVRFVTCPNRFVFFFDITIWCDIVAIVPFYLSLFGQENFFFWVQMLRVVRLITLVKIFKGSSSMGLRAFVLALQHSVAGMFVFVAVAITSMLILATCTYFAERGTFDGETWWRKCVAYDNCSGPNNTEPSPFQSISDAFWYTIVTMGTVGFSDQYPKSGIGQFVGGCTMLMGIFLMALPTMILNGHYDASGPADRVAHISWASIRQQNISRLARPPVPPKEQLMRRKGWAFKESEPTAAKVVDLKKRRRSTIFADQIEELMKLDAVDEKPIAVYKIPNTVPSKLGYLRRTKDPRRFLYDPILSLVLNTDGRPRAKAILGTDGMPTCVRFDILIDTPDAQATAEAAAKHIHPGATADVDNAGGWRVKHHSPLDSLKAILPTQPSVRYVLMPNMPRGGFRDPRGAGGVAMMSQSINASFAASTGKSPMARSLTRSTAGGVSTSIPGITTLPIYFIRIPYNDQINRTLGNEASYLKEDKVIDECLNTVLGSSLIITKLLPNNVVKKRVAVVLQMLENSRFHHEMTLIASKAATDEDVGKDRTAFVAESDALRLLKGIHNKVDLYDPSLELENPDVVDHEVSMTILNRLRRTLISTIPIRLKRSIYNDEMLVGSDTVIEVPLSLFQADQDDLVEEDALGYVEVTARSCAGSSVRLDFAIEATDKPIPALMSPMASALHHSATPKKTDLLRSPEDLPGFGILGSPRAPQRTGKKTVILFDEPMGRPEVRSPISFTENPQLTVMTPEEQSVRSGGGPPSAPPADS